MARPICPVSKKPRFPDKLEADLAIADTHRSNTHHRRRKYRDEPVRSYECSGCGGWHTTSKVLEENESHRTVSS